jgi:hypothetical protein
VTGSVRRRCTAIALGAACACATVPVPARDASAPPAKTAIPFKREPESGAGLAARAAGVLALGALAAYGGVAALKRSGLAGRTLPGRARRVRPVETVRLSRRSTLHVVEYRGEELLLAESEHGLRLVARHAEGDGDA